MIDNQETQGKIAAEVRDLSKCIKHKMELGDYISVPMPTVYGKPLDVYYAELADRIDAAAKRERDKLTYSFDPTKAGKSEAPDPSAYALEGLRADPAWREFYEKHPRTQYANAVKLRETLLEIVKRLEPIVKYMHPNKKERIGLTTVFAACEPIYKIAKAALAAPARNCDMGTDEEQGKRLRRFCLRQKWCDRCPLRQRSMTTQADCKLLWAQLPYDESEAAR